MSETGVRQYTPHMPSIETSSTSDSSTNSVPFTASFSSMTFLLGTPVTSRVSV